MKAQSKAFLEKARALIAQAHVMKSVGLDEAAGRTAYLAGLHAAQALIFETHERVFKKHSAVHGEFARLVKDDPRFDVPLRAFLGRAYNIKAIADYETGPDACISPEYAAETIADAMDFVDALTAMLADDPR